MKHLFIKKITSLLACMAVVVLASGASAASSQAAVKQVDYSSYSGEVFGLSPSEDLEVSLPENPSTGFLWQVTGLPVTLESPTSDYTPSSSRIGAGGTRRFYFSRRLVSAYETQNLEFSLLRPGTVVAARTFTVRFAVPTVCWPPASV